MKFKRCHGRLALDSTLTSEEVQRSIKHKHANEVQRKKLQGWGKPIVSDGNQNTREILVGGLIYTGNWKTFHDFLFWYLQHILGREWYDKNSSDNTKFKYPLIKIYNLLLAHQTKSKIIDGKISLPFTGAVSAYAWLSYNLYLISHNATLLALLLKRFKDKEQFAGAYYETFVAAIFIKAGFEIQFEDESDRKNSHCECSSPLKNHTTYL